MEINNDVAERLAIVLTQLHHADGTLFVPQQQADTISQLFNRSLTVAGALGVL
jgi:hypothetical protein